MFRTARAFLLVAPGAFLLVLVAYLVAHPRAAESYRQTLESCLDDAKYLRRLVERLMEQCRADTLSHDETPEEVDLTPLLNQCADQAVALGQEKNVRLIRKDRLLSMATGFNKRAKFDATFMISALKGSGVADLKTYLAAAMPEGPWHYADDDITDAPMRRLASEITREKIYNRLHEELPYAATVETTSWQDQGKTGIRIEQTIFVERDSQRSIVLGKGGRAIKQISVESRTELAVIVGRPVHLFLFVKVKDGWEHDPERYKEMGLDFPKD